MGRLDRCAGRRAQGAFWRANPESPTSRALALTLALVGLSVLADVYLIRLDADGQVPFWAGLSVLFEVSAFCAVFEWTR